MDTLHQRLLKSFDYLKDNGVVHTQTQFAEMVGKSQTQINGAFKDAPKRCTLGLMKAIADAFPDVLNREYLLNGEGDVAAPDMTMKPHFEAKASAGFMSATSEGEAGRMTPRIPGMREYDFTIEAQGNSMLPRIESGDLLVCRISDNRANPPIGKICVIDGKDGAVVKVLADADNEFITLHSLNPVYTDYRIDLAEVLGIAEVVGLVRSF
jgi:SOS-response transcriptional repressor LexA